PQGGYQGVFLPREADTKTLPPSEAAYQGIPPAKRETKPFLSPQSGTPKCTLPREAGEGRRGGCDRRKHLKLSALLEFTPAVRLLLNSFAASGIDSAYDCMSRKLSVWTKY